MRPFNYIVILFFVIKTALPTTDNIKNIFDNTKVTDKQVEREKEDNNTIKNDDEVINAVLFKYGVGSKIKGYTISTPTGYCQVSELPNYSGRNKRKFSIGFNLTNGRIAYLKGSLFPKIRFLKQKGRFSGKHQLGLAVFFLELTFV